MESQFDLLFQHLIRMNETGTVVRFIYYKIVIEEDPNYASTNLFIKLLNQEINKVADTFLYNGQSPHRMAYEYYVKLFNKNIFTYYVLAVVRNCRDIQIRDGQSTDGEYCISVDGGEVIYFIC